MNLSQDNKVKILIAIISIIPAILILKPRNDTCFNQRAEIESIDSKLNELEKLYKDDSVNISLQAKILELKAIKSDLQTKYSTECKE